MLQVAAVAGNKSLAELIKYFDDESVGKEVITSYLCLLNFLSEI